VAKWNFDRILDPEVNSWVRPYYEDIEAVEVVDKHTLRVHMKEPSGALHRVLAGYFQGIPMASPKAYELYGKQWGRHPIGTGPYKMKAWVPGDRVILEKNPHYFKDGLPYLDTLEFVVMREPLTASAALRAREIDFIARVPLQQVFVLEKIPDIQVVNGPEMAPTVALLNMRVKPFDDVRARRAVGGYGINRAKIAKLGFDGRVNPLVSVLPPGVPDALDLNEMYPYRPDEAKRLLKELGFDETNPLKLTILVPNHDLTLADIAALIAHQLEKIGVTSKITVLDAIAWVDRVPQVGGDGAPVETGNGSGGAPAHQRRYAALDRRPALLDQCDRLPLLSGISQPGEKLSFLQPGLPVFGTGVAGEISEGKCVEWCGRRAHENSAIHTPRSDQHARMLVKHDLGAVAQAWRCPQGRLCQRHLAL
jgi:ABC-type transport system substrate-binding protein